MIDQKVRLMQLRNFFVKMLSHTPFQNVSLDVYTISAFVNLQVSDLGLAVQAEVENLKQNVLRLTPLTCTLAHKAA